MKKKTDKKLSIDLVTVRKLETELTPDQLRHAAGGAGAERPSAECGSVHAVC
jgi:hypothetical protein